MLSRPSFRLACLGLLTTALVGCGGEASNTVVEGKVTVDGAPVAGVQLGFYPPSGDTQMLAATTDAEGKFRAVAPGARELPDGTYRVTAAKYAPKKGAKILPDTAEDIEQLKMAGAVANELPAQYEDPAKTPLKAEVKRGGRTTTDLAVTKSEAAAK